MVLLKKMNNNELDNFKLKNIEFQDAVLSIFDKDKNEALSKDELKNILNFINRNKGRFSNTKIIKATTTTTMYQDKSRSPRPGSSRSRPI